MKRLLLAALAIALTFTVKAQDSPKYGGSGTFNFGIQTMDLAPINDIITRYGYGALSDVNTAIGGGGQFYLGSWVLMGEGGFVGQEEVQNNNYTLRFGAGYGMFSLGYGIVDTDRFFLYPSVGGGFFGTGLNLTRRNQGASFEDIFAEPQGNEDGSVSAGAFTGTAQLAVNADFWLQSKDGNAYGTMLGLSLGYRFSGDASFENLGGTELVNSPGFNPGGAFITLRIGGGYRGHKDGK